MIDNICKNIRNMDIPYLNCRCTLKFHIENGVVAESDGGVICNVPGAVCPDCIESVLEMVADPPGLIVIDQLSSTMAEELLRNFTFLLPKSGATKFFALLFPEVGLEGKP